MNSNIGSRIDRMGVDEGNLLLIVMGAERFILTSTVAIEV